LEEHGAILEDAVPTTSSRPRYRLARDFAELFSPELGGVQLSGAITAWQARHLTPTARARMALLAQHTTSSMGAQVVFPDGNTRVLAAGPSTPLLKAVVESFAPNFLHQPIVLIVTESRRRLAYEDADQLRRIGLTPDPRVMPDLLLADVGVPNGDLRLVFVECVATTGAMTQERQSALRNWLSSSKLERAEAVFGTVFRDRADPVFRRLVGELVWGSFVWFASEPENIAVLLEGGRFDPCGKLDELAK
jgi:BsuBI/PstI restriction endonuclease domain